MTAPQHIAGETDRFHRAALRAREPQRDAAVYACEQLHAAGIEPAAPEVLQWLEQHGREVGRTTVWKAVTDYRLSKLNDGLFSGGVNTKHDSEQSTEQPSGGTNVFTLDQPGPAGPAPAAADKTPEQGRGEHATEQHEPGEQRPPVAANAPAAFAERSPTDMGDSGHMGTTADGPATEQVNTEPPAKKKVRPRRGLPTWPVLLMAFPAFVAIWSGWVGLGEATGFGVVHPLPGIADGFTINSAITLPIGVEAYASYALYVWLSGKIKTNITRNYAMVSAFVSLAVGAAGQVAFHYMEARHITVTPWWIITMVASLPVAVVGMGAVLAHLILRERHIEND